MTKTEVINEMEIFITLNKYKTHQSVKKVHTARSDYLVSKLFSLTIVSNVFMRDGTYPLLFTQSRPEDQV